MKKKIKIVVTIVITLVLIAFIMFLIDKNRVENKQLPIFCINIQTIKDGGSKIYMGVGYKVINFNMLNGYNDIKIGSWFMKYEDFKDEYKQKDTIEIIGNQMNNVYKTNLQDLPIEYTKEQAILDECFLITDKLYNKSKLDSFIYNTSAFAKKRIQDKIRIVVFTIEGQMHIIEIEYTKEGNYIIRKDYSRDKYITEQERDIKTKEYMGEVYTISQEEGTSKVYLKLGIYKQAPNDLENKQEIVTYSKDLPIVEFPSFYGKILESKENSILIETLQGEEERESSSDKFILSIKENNYKVGDIINIIYTGIIRETYPAQIDIIKTIKVDPSEPNLIYTIGKQRNNIETILENNKKYEYTIYSYEGNVDILIDEKIMSLKDAIMQDEIDIQDIINKAEEESKQGKNIKETYQDGGSIIYKYPNYTILKHNKLSGNKDVYIGSTNLDINKIL